MGFLAVLRVAERILLETTGTQRAVLMKLGIQVPHLHLHLFPVSAQAGRDDVFRMIEGQEPDGSKDPGTFLDLPEEQPDRKVWLASGRLAPTAGR